MAMAIASLFDISLGWPRARCLAKGCRPSAFRCVHKEGFPPTVIELVTTNRSCMVVTILSLAFDDHSWRMLNCSSLGADHGFHLDSILDGGVLGRQTVLALCIINLRAEDFCSFPRGERYTVV